MVRSVGAITPRASPPTSIGSMQATSNPKAYTMFPATTLRSQPRPGLAGRVLQAFHLLYQDANAGVQRTLSEMKVESVGPLCFTAHNAPLSNKIPHPSQMSDDGVLRSAVHFKMSVWFSKRNRRHRFPHQVHVPTLLCTINKLNVRENLCSRPPA